MLGVILTHGFAQAGQTVWVAPFLGEWGTTNISPLIGFGIVLLAPSIVDMVKKAIGAPGLAEGIGGPLGAGWGVVSGPPRMAGRVAYRAGVSGAAGWLEESAPAGAGGAGRRLAGRIIRGAAGVR